MYITALKFKNGCFDVYADDELFCRINDETVVKLGLKAGMEIDEAAADEILEISQKQAAIRDGMKLLAASAKAKADFIKKLIHKGHSATAAKEAAEFFEDKGFIDDRKFAESYVHDAMKLKKDGKMKISFSLKKYGISEEIISDILEETDDSEGLRALAEKELSRTRDINKIKRKLYSKGYSIWDINSILDELGGSDFEI